MSHPTLKRPHSPTTTTSTTEPAAKKPKPSPPDPTSTTTSTTTPPLTPPPPTRTDNLLALYNLTTLQSTVARRDPLTGEKINPLRKHYGGKVKSLGLEGKDRPLKKSGELEGLVDPGWNERMPDGRTLWEIQREEALLGAATLVDGVDGGMMAKLGGALGGLKAGHMPKGEHESWKNLLGLDEPASTATGPQAAMGKALSPTGAFLAKTAPGMAVRNSAPASPNNRGRPERTGRKRRYDDSSFEGYD